MNPHPRRGIVVNNDPDSPYSTYEFIDSGANGLAKLGLFLAAPDDYLGDALLRLIYEIQLVEQPDEDEDENFVPENSSVDKVPLVKLIWVTPRIVPATLIREAIYVVDEKYFENGMLPPFRVGRKGVYRIR